ncbi:MAG: hypothetical protein CL707_04490, partial [Chloroflexi bacterium]|nr:hypothetical protein [Chloroflexota bacterium]
MLQNLNISRTSIIHIATLMMAGLIVYFLLFNPGMIFGQEQQEDEMSQDGFEDEFIVDEPEITEPQWPSDHDPTWSNTLDSALQDPYFVDLLAEQEAHGDASHLDMWSSHTDEESHSSALSNHGDASHLDIWSNHSEEQSHSSEFSNHGDASHLDIFSSHADEQSHASALSNHGEMSHLDIYSSHDESQSHGAAVSEHGDASHLDIWSSHSDAESHSPTLSEHGD